MRTESRSPKAPATTPRGKTPVSAQRAKTGQSDAQRVNRGTVPRLDPGTARRAVGRTNAPKGGRGK
jgi:hypothetical protein